MRLLLLADVHANWEALLGLQRAEARPDAVLFAGDAVGYGPDPAPCVRWLLTHAAAAVRGDHDNALVEGTSRDFQGELEEAARETLLHAGVLLGPDDTAGLRGWPLTADLTLGGARFHLVHGTPTDPLTGRLDPATCPEADLERLFGALEADVIVLGHTHVPALRRFKDKLLVNPGSLGQPRYGVPDATYAVWDDGRVQIRHLHYDHDASRQRLRLSPLSPEVIEQLSRVLETGLV